MNDKLHPNDNQRRFFEQHLLGEEPTILTLKVRKQESRGFSVNIRGPFTLAEYPFSEPETVIDATWAGKPESLGHLHVCWAEVRFAKLSETNEAVRRNIQYEWELDFFATQEDAMRHDPRNDDRRLFWFYLKDENHKAVQNLQAQKGQVLSVA
jgi:hypothetical protein